MCFTPISHRPDGIARIADRVLVIPDRQRVAGFKTAQVPATLGEAVAGRPLDNVSTRGTSTSARAQTDDVVAPLAREGPRLPKLTDPTTAWRSHTMELWSGKRDRAIETATGTAVRYHGGLPPVPIRWMIVRDPSGLFSLIVSWMNHIAATHRTAPQATARYRKTRLAVADAIAAVRCERWIHQTSSISHSSRYSRTIPINIWSRMETAVAHAR